MLSRIEVSLDCLQDVSGQVPIEKMYALWEMAIRLTGDRLFAVRVAEQVPFGTYRLLDYALAASATPREALLRSTRLFGVMNNSLDLSFGLRRDAAFLELNSLSGAGSIPRPYVEYIFAIYLARLRFVTQTEWKPVEVHMANRDSGATREMGDESLLGAPVRFHPTPNRMVLPRACMEMRQPLADPELCESLENCALRQMQKSSHAGHLLLRIQDALIDNLEEGDISLAFLARKLARSRRDLQREMYACGLTFRELLERVRQERAFALLRERDLPIEEIAAKLQFAGASSFDHAFQRWTGESPHQYRKHLQ